MRSITETTHVQIVANKVGLPETWGKTETVRDLILEKRGLRGHGKLEHLGGSTKSVKRGIRMKLEYE